MKHTLKLLGFGLLAATMLSSCDTYVDAGGHAHAGNRPGGYYRGHSHSHTHTNHYYSNRSAPRRSGSLINANTNIGLGL